MLVIFNRRRSEINGFNVLFRAFHDPVASVLQVAGAIVRRTNNHIGGTGQLLKVIRPVCKIECITGQKIKVANIECIDHVNEPRDVFIGRIIFTKQILLVQEQFLCRTAGVKGQCDSLYAQSKVVGENL